MAKLPEISYRQVSRPRGQDPSVAVGEYRQRQSMVNAAFAAGKAVADAYQEDDVNIALADHREAGAQTVRFIEENRTLTKDQLKKFGILDRVDITNPVTGEEYEMVPRHIWRTALLENELNNSREMYGNRIQSPNARRSWFADIEQADSQVISRSVAQTARDAWEYRVDDLTNRREAATEAGDWDLVEQVQDSELYKDIYASEPGLKALHEQEVAKGRELTAINIRSMTTDPDQLNDLIADITDPEYAAKSALNDTELLKTVSAVVTRRNAIDSALEDAVEEEQDQLAIDTLIGLSTGVLTLADVNERANKLGQAHHTRLVTTSYTMAERSTNPMEERRLGYRIMLLNAGVIPGGMSFSEAVSEVRKDILNATLTLGPEGGEEILLSLDAARTLNTDLDKVEEKPWVNQAYKTLTRDAYRMITGGELDLTGQMEARQLGTAEAGIYVQAMNSLRTWVEQNGGTAADLSVWRTQNLPAFTQQAANVGIQKVEDESLNAEIVKRHPDGLVDVDATRSHIGNLLLENQDNKAVIMKIQAAGLRFDSWVQTYGGVYAN